MKINIRKRYIKKLKSHLIYVGSLERASLATINHEILLYMDVHTTYDDLVMHFGEPEELAESFMDNYDETIVRKKLKLKKLSLILCTVVLITSIIIIVLVTINHINAQNSYITREKEFITEN